MYAPNILIEHLNSLSKPKKIDRVQSKSKLKRKEKRKRTGNNIDLVENKILQYICVHADSTAYDIYRNGTLYLGGYINYKSIRRYIRDLSKKRLIKISPRGAKKHRAKPCRLTISGVYHLILKLRMMPWDVYKGDFKESW